MSSRRLVPMLVACALIAGPTASAQQSTQAPGACAGVPVTIEHADGDEVALACDGARAAFAFLMPLHLRLPHALTVELADRLPEGLSRGAVGCFARPTGRIVVLRYERFALHGTWFGLPVEPSLYRSVFAHEVAHAIAACHAGERRLSSPAQEYVAYVAMLATMSPALRETVLQRHPGTGFDNEHQINELVYGFDTTLFAVESYRHWLRQTDPPAFLRRVLEGAAIPGLGPGS